MSASDSAYTPLLPSSPSQSPSSSFDLPRPPPPASSPKSRAAIATHVDVLFRQWTSEIAGRIRTKKLLGAAARSRAGRPKEGVRIWKSVFREEDGEDGGRDSELDQDGESRREEKGKGKEVVREALSGRTLDHAELMSRGTFDALVDRVRLAISQGTQPRLNSKGSSGSYFARDAAGSTLGIFKPADEEPYGRLNPKLTKWVHRNFFSRVIPFGRSCLIPQLSYLSEAAASLIDRRLETNIVPRTEVVALSSPAFFYDWIDRERSKPGPNRRELPEKDGSFQVFLNGYQDASLFLRNHPYPGRSLSQTLDDSPRRKKRINLLAPFTWLCGRAEAEELEEEDEDDEEAGWGWGGEDERNEGGTSQNRGPRPQKFKWTEEMMDSFRLELEKLVLLDYLIRNTDRGLDNFMIRGCVCSHTDSGSPTSRSATPIPSNGPTPIPPMSTSSHSHTPVCAPHMHIAAIDNSLAFPHAHPSGWRSFTYGWLYLPLSLIGVPFSPETRQHFLEKLESKEWWEETARELEALFRMDKGFEEKMWKRQLAVMKGQGWNIVQTLRAEDEGPLDLCRRGKRLVWDDYVEIPVADSTTSRPQTPLSSAPSPAKPVSPNSSSRPTPSRHRSLSKVLSLHLPEEKMGEITGISMMAHLDRVAEVEMDLKKTFGMLDSPRSARHSSEEQRSGIEGSTSEEADWKARVRDRVSFDGARPAPEVLAAWGHKRAESTVWGGRRGSGALANGKGKGAYQKLDSETEEEEASLLNGHGAKSWLSEFGEADASGEESQEDGVQRTGEGKQRSRVVIVERLESVKEEPGFWWSN